MRLLSTFSGIDSRPATNLGRASEEKSDNLKNEELETGPFAHDFCDDPAWVGVVDDNFSFLRRRCGDSFGDFLDAVHFEELGEVVSDIMIQYVVDGCRWWRRFLPVVHPSLLLICERLEDFLLFALGKLRHPMDERRHVHKPGEGLRSVKLHLLGRA